MAEGAGARASSSRVEETRGRTRTPACRPPGEARRMPKSRSLIGRAAVAACLILSCARSVSAQQPDQPVASPAPDQPQFLSRADFQVSMSALSGDDIRFQWDNHWAGSFDMLDYVAGRIGISGDYEAVLGNELRLFDPNQANYTLEGFETGRI